jgi:hypothetical protein
MGDFSTRDDGGPTDKTHALMVRVPDRQEDGESLRFVTLHRERQVFQHLPQYDQPVLQQFLILETWRS